jgi:hypothetical protein
MSRIPIVFLARDWYRPGSGTGRNATSASPILERLRRLLEQDEQRRARSGAWPPPITLPRVGGDSPAP